MRSRRRLSACRKRRLSKRQNETGDGERERRKNEHWPSLCGKCLLMRQMDNRHSFLEMGGMIDRGWQFHVEVQSDGKSSGLDRSAGRRGWVVNLTAFFIWASAADA